ncbi:hypothetical protein ECMP0209401_3191 [Escherichia coli MP020940.1]|nr:hypothetical protein EC2749250_0279 [Escherichia coli 2749250]EMX54086.1 hypothetical protein ECMP0209401_3191 [Escherichia coli MP020940.1]EMZ95632.1 hypothetical protein ECP03048161_3289 [Escherichia coli P0304816.1]ENF18373.1 hypothetical protein ECP030481611_2956 [Escherichia coli P0304816.11]ENF23115.1 hypothetical protein ECP030481610_2942 [Escherichia coli P0304816.10]ENF29825.1 hypothetical protein ECP030481612_2823 [Escherichia coli P0304816.12]ENF39690.1 hypothetical protein ECP0
MDYYQRLEPLKTECVVRHQKGRKTQQSTFYTVASVPLISQLPAQIGIPIEAPTK